MSATAQEKPARRIVLWSLAALVGGCASSHGLKPEATLRTADSLSAAGTTGAAH